MDTTYKLFSYGINPFDRSSGAFLRTAGAFALAVLLIVHICMTTTGHSITSHLRAMCTVWEEFLPAYPDERVPAEYN